ncbi:hypothetical protein MMC14_008795 [Varicellaria rhodocarpa]|nr:hypothetical protein [Varicellaria rhodocarpa]
MEDFNDDKIPSYEESIQQQGAFRSITTSTSADSKSNSYLNPLLNLPFPGQLAGVRSHRISAIIETYISPLLQSQLASGLYKTTLVLVPSNVTALQQPGPSSSAEESRNRYIDGKSVDDGNSISKSDDQDEAIVVGFPSSQYVKLVRLHGGENYTLEFWRQQAVITELESALKGRLEKSGFRIAATSKAKGGEATPVGSPGVRDSTKSKTGFFSRKSRGSSSSQGREESTGPDTAAPTSNWSLIREEALDSDHARVKVSLQDVCLRVVTEMGLYETRTGKAVVADIEIGA